MMDFNSTIDTSNITDGGGFVLLPEGTYQALCVKMDRKMSSTGRWMGVLTLNITTPSGATSTMRENLILSEKALWKAKQYMSAAGIPCDPITPASWDAIPGSQVAVEVIVEPWVGDDGTTRESNRVKRFLPLANLAPAPVAPAPAPVAQPAPAPAAAPQWGGGWGQPQPVYGQPAPVPEYADEDITF